MSENDDNRNDNDNDNHTTEGISERDASTPRPQHGDFANVDSSPDPMQFVRYLTRSDGEPLTERQRLSYALLEAREGLRLLDAGCGIGDDVRALAQIVGVSGEVVGLDKSETLLAEARRRSAGVAHPGTFQAGDIHSLPFADATFDGCRAERVLVHSDDPLLALKEMARVTRTGGRVVVTETDLDTVIFHCSDHSVARRLTQLHCDSVRNGWIGRRLPDLFHQCGLTDLQIVPTTTHSTHLSAYPRNLVALAQRRNVLTADEALATLAEWDAREREGAYLEFGLFFTVAGRRH